MRIRREAPIGRLTKRSEFLAAATGRRFHTERMTLQGRVRDEAEGIPGLRVGLTLTKRVGHAVTRNRIRRRLRGAVLEAGLAFRATLLDVVVIGRFEARDADYPTLVDDLSRGLATVAKPRSPRRPIAEGGPVRT